MELTIELKDIKRIINKYDFLSGISVKSSSFEFENGINEHHFIFSTKGDRGNVQEKIEHTLLAFKTLQSEYFFGADLTPVFCRWFLSDAANQGKHIPDNSLGCAQSVIEQPPLDGSKVALWVYCINGIKSEQIGKNLFLSRHGKYSHLWLGNKTSGIEDSKESTVRQLRYFANELKNIDCSLLDNCIRTWFFVRDVDVNYKGVVDGRNEVFKEEGLNPSTHFISSTGIGGRDISAKDTVSFNACAIDGIVKDQVGFLKGSSHLNPTIEYGVAFERGSYVDYGDRRHVFISGTASIDNQGKIMYPEDIEMQALRMIENVEVLLREAETDWENVGHLIIYLRDLSDYEKLEKVFSERFPEIPRIITLAPVCRPGWLIEMECMACKPQECLRYEPF